MDFQIRVQTIFIISVYILFSTALKDLTVFVKECNVITQQITLGANMYRKRI